MNMDRISELLEIYAKSGLQDLVSINPPPRYFPEDDFTKVRFVPNDFGMRSIELHDLKGGGKYFRIHHRETAPAWLREAMQSWPDVRTSAKFGTNFNGDPLAAATALAQLLRSKGS